MNNNKKKHAESVELVAKTLYEKELEYERNEVYPKESIWPSLKKEIQNHGYECEIQNTAEYICRNNPDEFRDIIMKYYKICTIDTEKSFLMSCLINKKNAELTPFVLEEYEKLFDKNASLFNTMVMNFIFKTKSLKYKDLYINILKNKKLKRNIIDIFPAIESLKIKEVEEMLVEFLKDEEIVGGEGNCMKHHILCSLAKYKDPDLLYLFQQYSNDTDKEVRKVCEAAIKRIEAVK